jgi:hypothetical protein
MCERISSEGLINDNKKPPRKRGGVKCGCIRYSKTYLIISSPTFAVGSTDVIFLILFHAAQQALSFPQID